MSGHNMGVREERFLQNHNIRHDLISSEFGNWRAVIIWCASFGSSGPAQMSRAHSAAAPGNE